MKFLKLLPAVAALLLASCSAPRYLVKTYELDYSRYGGDDFFITESNSVNFNYDPIESLTSVIISGKLGGYGPWADAKPESGLREIVAKAKASGANGIINLQIRPYDGTLAGDKRDGLIITGMAIKK